MPNLVDLFGFPITPEATLASEIAARKAFTAPPDGARGDGWENPLTGIGTDSDKTKHGQFFPTSRVMDSELTSLYSGSDLVARIVDDPPFHMFREGFEVSAQGVSDADADTVIDFCEEEYELSSTFVEGYTWGRLYGGNLLVMGIDDGRMPWEPVDENSIRSIDFVANVDRRYAYVQSVYCGFDAPRAKYGQPETYLIANAFAGQGWNSLASTIRKKTPRALQRSGAFVSLIHESRVIRFDGNRADVQTRQQLAGWNWSVIQRVYDAVRQFEHAFDSVSYLLSDASQMVFKLQGLVKAIASRQSQAITSRALLMEQTRSTVRGIMLDAGNADGKGAESAERQPTPLSGVADILDRNMMRVASAAKRPVSVLFGRAPAGLNATGDADMRSWYDDLSADQKKDAAPKIRQFLRLVALAKRGPLGGRDVKWQIEFAPLWAPTDMEAAQARYQQAQADALYVESAIIPAQVVAAARAEDYPALKLDEVEKEVEDLDLEDFYAEPPQPGEPGYVDPNPAPGAAPPGGAKPGVKKAPPPKKP